MTNTFTRRILPLAFIVGGVAGYALKTNVGPSPEAEFQSGRNAGYEQGYTKASENTQISSAKIRDLNGDKTNELILIQNDGLRQILSANPSNISRTPVDYIPVKEARRFEEEFMETLYGIRQTDVRAEKERETRKLVKEHNNAKRALDLKYDSIELGGVKK